ncbi:MAG TPA: VOC family protein [Solirubrobacteraceae bacterium]|jgi:catechol 2,3-dioxygenase
MEPAPPIDPSLRISSVRLDVGDLARSSEFYERVLGLPLISRDEDRALLGADAQRPALQLSAVDQPTLASPRSTGLFHVAWLHPSRAALADTVRRIAGARWPIDGASDHGVSEALYLSDPDGLGIEIYADRPREQWQRPADGHGVRMFTLALDIDDLLAQSRGQPQAMVAPGTSIGHVHLKVADVPRAFGFYHDALGLQEQAQLPSAAFLSAGGYHHHIGLNSWQSAGASPPPEDAPRLRAIEFELGGDDALAALRQRVAGAATDGAERPTTSSHDAGDVSVEDPDGNLLSFAAPSS